MKLSKIETDMFCSWFEEYSEIYIKILDILAKCNLQDLRTIYESLFEIGFRSEK